MDRDRAILIIDDDAVNRILLSQTVARKLKLGVGDRVSAYFLGGGQQMRARRFTVAGIFQTHFSVVDEQLALTDLRTVGRLNQWAAQDVSGLELTLAGGADLAQQTTQENIRRRDNRRAANQ